MKLCSCCIEHFKCVLVFGCELHGHKTLKNGHLETQSPKLNQPYIVCKQSIGTVLKIALKIAACTNNEQI